MFVDNSFNLFCTEKVKRPFNIVIFLLKFIHQERINFNITRPFYFPISSHFLVTLFKEILNVGTIAL